MNHRSVRISLALLTTAALMLTACERNGGTAATSADSLPGADVNVPTQAQADAEAAVTITDANADTEFEKLQREIDTESGD